MIDELQRSVVSLRKLKSIAKGQVDNLKDGEDDALRDAGKALIKAIKDWEAGQINMDREFFQDALNWPDKVHSDLQFLAFSIDWAVPPMTQGVTDRFDDVAAAWKAAMAVRDSVMAKEAAAFNKAFADSGRAILPQPEFTKSE